VFSDANDILLRVVFIIPMILSLNVHEWAHAWSAYRLGDDTAFRMGRLTLNPVPHIDPIGTLLLPLFGVPFGWAKPVPVVPSRFRRDVNMNTGMMLTALAGPISNIVLALICGVIFGLLGRFAPEMLQNQGTVMLLQYAITLNIALAVFNMLPIPPLDGSRVVEGFLPYNLRDSWASVVRLAPLLLLGFMIFGSRLLDGPRRFLEGYVTHLILAIAG
jgi:Zn-dependent protease